ncbi:hypothetical protein CQA86_32530, partial [Klebsiella pneumoniae]
MNRWRQVNVIGYTGAEIDDAAGGQIPDSTVMVDLGSPRLFLMNRWRQVNVIGYTGAEIDDAAGGQ